MKKLVLFEMLGVALATLTTALLLGCSGIQVDEKTVNLDGFWSLSHSEFDIEGMNSLCADFELIAVSEPYALGTHFMIEGDSISLFRYPFEYYGTYKFQLSGDSLIVRAGRNSAVNFVVQKPNNSTLVLKFEEELNPSCVLPSVTNYTRSTPNPEMIAKLKRDSISYESMVGKWWYLRTEIGYNDGSEPTILHFPKGMPDSLFISKELLSKNALQPSIELRLNNKMVKMFIKDLHEDSFILEPEFKKDARLFNSFMDYGEYGGIDTLYHEIMYWR